MRTVRSASLAALVVALSAGAWSCSGPQRSNQARWTGTDDATGQPVNIVQGAMPENHSFNGVYQSPQVGEIHLIQTGDSVVGRYEYDRGSCHATGRLEGTANGNVLHFNFTESQRECGRLAPITGRGFFLYHVESMGEVTRGRLFGRWGYGQNEEGGGNWMGFKLPNRQPSMPDTEADGGT